MTEAAALLIALLGVNAPGDRTAVVGAPAVEVLVKGALGRHPSLRQIEARILEARQRAPQRLGLPDPRVSIGLEAMPLWPARFDASPMTGLQVSLTQVIPWPSRLSLAARMEERGVAVERALLGEARLRLAAAIRLAAIEIAFHEADRGLTARRAQVLDRFLALVTDRYRVQQASLADLLKGRLARSRVEDQLLQIARQRDAAAARLRALGARPQEEKLPTLALPSTPARVAPLGALLALAARERPLLASHRARVAVQTARKRHARTGYYPDFGVTLGYRYRQDSGMDPVDGRDFYSIGVSVSIPLFSLSRTRAAIREAEAARAREAHGLEAALVEVSREVRTARDAVLRLQARQRLYEARILPEAREAIPAALAAYTTGKGDFLSLLEQERVLYEEEARLLGVRAGLAAEWEKLRAATGSPTPERAP